MKFRRFTSAALAAAIFATGTSVVAFAEQDANMTKELTYVKERIQIPKEYSEFTHSTSKRYNNTSYSFNWSTKDGTKGINVTISGKVITNYNCHDYEKPYDWTPHFSKVSEKELLAKAKDYIKQLNPTIMDRTEIEEDSFRVDLTGNSATLSFHRTANGIPVSGQTGSITLDKDTGELQSYRYNWILGAGFKDPKNIISEETAEEAYVREFPIKLSYGIRHDWEKDEYVPYLVYRQQISGEIDAFTGKLSTFEESYGAYEDMDAEVEEDVDDANPGTGGGNSVEFTENELKQLELEKNLITAEEALAKLKAMDAFYIPEGVDIRSESCVFNEEIGAYVRGVVLRGTAEGYIDTDGDIVMPLNDSYEKPEGAKSTSQSIYMNFTMNAETGELIRFYCGDIDNKTSLDVTETNKKAAKVLKSLLGKNASKFKVNDNISGNVSKVYDKYVNGKAVGNPRNRSIHYHLNRVAYGIDCIDEYVNLTVGNSGYITEYNLCFRNMVYPKPTNIITAKKAYENFFDQVGLDLKYRCAYRTKDKKIVTALVYNSPRNLIMDAFTGAVTDYSGVPVVVEETLSGYTDLEGSKYKKYAEKLYSYNISIADENGKLRENDAITISEFSKLLSMAREYVSVSDIKDTSKKLTRQMAAKLFVTGVYGNEVAELKGIFKAPYTDVAADSEYVGYIAIAKASGIMKGATSTKFKPKTYLKRGDALKLIYNYLS